MRQTIAFFRFVAAVSIFFACSAYAESSERTIEAQDARAWLKKIQVAAQRLNYSGTFVYQQANQMRTSRITHLLDGKNEIEKLEILDGSPREYLRNNEEVICYVPDAKTVVIEKRVTQDVFPAILAVDPTDLGAYYNLKKGETGRIAGHDCQAILLEPKDDLRYGYKLWADKSTGLLLRAQTLDEKREVVEQISFTQISIGNIDRSRAKPSFPNTANWRVENAVMSQVDLSGWAVKSLPRGFKKIREVKRIVSESSTATVSSPASKGRSAIPEKEREVSQIVFSDGIAAISVFIEPESHSRTEGSMQQGALNVIGKRHGDFWLTIVGEVPLAAIKQVANSIEFKSK